MYPKAAKIIKKSIPNRIWSEKHDFSKNSTSPRRDTHFGGSRVPQTLPKSTKNTPETDKKSNQNFDGFFNRFFNDFSSIWAPCGAHFGRQNPLKRGGGGKESRGLLRRLRAERVQEYPQNPKMGAQGHHKTPKWTSKGAPRAPKWSLLAPLRAPRAIKNSPSVKQNLSKTI